MSDIEKIRAGIAMRNVDLMVGDLVTFKDCQNDKKPVIIKVMELHRYDDLILASIDGNKFYDELELDDEIVGIPLTPEILEKNGWMKFQMYYRLGIDEEQYLEYYPHEGRLQRLYIHKDNSREVVFTVSGIFYVHIMQHALHLCSIEYKNTFEI